MAVKCPLACHKPSCRCNPHSHTLSLPAGVNASVPTCTRYCHRACEGPLQRLLLLAGCIQCAGQDWPGGGSSGGGLLHHMALLQWWSQGQNGRRGRESMGLRGFALVRKLLFMHMAIHAPAGVSRLTEEQLNCSCWCVYCAGHSAAAAHLVSDPGGYDAAIGAQEDGPRDVQPAS
jgi:hypothetical protein